MKPNFLKEKESSVSVLEKQTAHDQQKPTSKTQEEKITQNSFKQNQKVEEQTKVNLFSAKAFESAKEIAEKQNLFSNKKQEFVPVAPAKPLMEEVKEIEKEQLFEPTTEIEDEAEQFVNFSAKPKSKKKEWKFRVKLLTIIYCAVVAVSAGWVVTNSIRIAQINNTIQQSQSLVNASDIKYVQKIQELENLKDQPPKYENSDLIPIEEFITVTPRPLQDITEYEQVSNWFDSIVNWFGNLFGGWKYWINTHYTHYKRGY